MSLWSKRVNLGYNFRLSNHVNIHVLNDNELLLVSDIYSQSMNLISQTLWKFNITSKKFIKWHPCTEEFKYSTSSVSDDKTKLYIFSDTGHVITVNLITGKSRKSLKSYYDGSHAKSLFINGQFHIFGGWRSHNKAHYIWNEKRRELTEIHKFDEMTDVEALNHFAMGYIRSKNMILFMDWRTSKCIYSYDINTNKCIKTDYDRLGKEFCAAVVSIDEQFMFAFESAYDKEAGSICVMDLNTMQFRKQQVTLPKDARIGKVCVKNNLKKVEYVSRGYIREAVRENDIELPMDIIKTIAEFFTLETIFMLHQHNLWSIEVAEIIQHLKDDFKVVEGLQKAGDDKTRDSEQYEDKE